MIKKFLIVLALVTSFGFTFLGCTHVVEERPVKLSSVRQVRSDLETINKNISRTAYKKALQDKQGLEKFRLVQILQKTPEDPPQYRFFGIEPNTAPAVLGLANADILVSANDYIIYDPAKFKGYLILLEQEKDAEIEIIRAGQPFLLKYKFE